MNGSSFWFWVVLLVVVLAVINAVKKSGGRRGRWGTGEMRLCRGCATPNPGMARFCRVCGRPLE